MEVELDLVRGRPSQVPSALLGSIDVKLIRSVDPFDPKHSEE